MIDINLSRKIGIMPECSIFMDEKDTADIQRQKVTELTK